MANYVLKEMPAGMGNGSEGKTFPKMQVYTEFDYDKVVELVHTNSPAFSEATVRGVLDTLAVVLKSYLPMGHTMKIDNLGVFSLSLEFADNEPETVNQQEDTRNSGNGTQEEIPSCKGQRREFQGRQASCGSNQQGEHLRAHIWQSLISLALLPRGASATSAEPYRQTRLHHLARIRQPQQPQLQHRFSRTRQTRPRPSLRHQAQRRRLPQSLGPQVNILHFELVTKGEPQGVAAPSFVQHLVVTKVGQSDIVT